MKRSRTKDYTPIMWSEYFTEKKDVRIDDQHTFRVYLSRPPQEDGPVIVLLVNTRRAQLSCTLGTLIFFFEPFQHGGGFSALTWSHFTVEYIFYGFFSVCRATDAEHLKSYVYYALQTEIISVLHCQCLAIDLRGHGDSIVADESDLSAETLAT